MRRTPVRRAQAVVMLAATVLTACSGRLSDRVTASSGGDTAISVAEDSATAASIEAELSRIEADLATTESMLDEPLPDRP